MKLLCGKLKSLEQASLIYHWLTEKQGIVNQCQFVLLKCMISGYLGVGLYQSHLVSQG